jgi:hypothetical protein
MGTLSGSCVENRPYRLGGLREADSNQLPHFEETTVRPGHVCRLSFVEFDEVGDFWDRRQLGTTADEIRNSKKPVFLVIFIHGWHHNANERKPVGKNPGDVETFRCLLSQLAASDSTSEVQVHGVYLGWRGRVVEGFLDYLTFYSRKGAAARVAGAPMTETIFELIRQTRKNNPDKSRCVAIGHSFGALVLEKIMAQAIAGSIFAQDIQSGGRPFNTPADLILLVNSAAESIYAKEQSDMLVRIGYQDSVNANRPLLVSITSESDSATGHWFPLGTFLPTFFAERRYRGDRRRDAGNHELAQQRPYLRTTPGHNFSMFTHQMVRMDPPPDSPSPSVVAQRENKQTDKCLEPNPAFDENMQHPRPLAFATSDPDDPNQFMWWHFKRLENHDSPYWILQVPDEVIHGHAPIFTPQARAMMAALFRLANPKSEQGPRQMRLRP